MKFVIYDYDDVEKVCEIPDKKVSEIYVHVISGDEVVTVTFEDNTFEKFDASDCRRIGFDDGSYTVTGEDIEKWMNFKPSGERTNSYERQRMFYDL